MNVALPSSVSGSWTQACAWPNGDQDGGRGPGRQNVETESDWGQDEWTNPSPGCENWNRRRWDPGKQTPLRRLSQQLFPGHFPLRERWHRSEPDWYRQKQNPSSWTVRAARGRGPAGDLCPDPAVPPHPPSQHDSAPRGFFCCLLMDPWITTVCLSRLLPVRGFWGDILKAGIH